MRIDNTVPTNIVPTTLRIAAMAVASIETLQGKSGAQVMCPGLNKLQNLLTTAQFMYINRQFLNVSFT